MDEKYFFKIRELSAKYNHPCEDIPINFVWVFELIEKIEMQLSEEHKQCTLCYLQSPCEYQNENAMLQNELLVDKNGWIPCSERLPEKLEPVNVTWVNRKPELYYAHIKDVPFVATAFYHNGKWWWYSCVCEDYLLEYGKSECDAVDRDIDILAWKPLPEPYKAKGELG